MTPKLAGLFPQQFGTVAGAVAQVFFDPQELIVLGDSVRSRCRSRLDLARPEAGAEINSALSTREAKRAAKTRCTGFGRYSAEDHGECRDLASSTRPNAFDRYGSLVDEIVSV